VPTRSILPTDKTVRGARNGSGKKGGEGDQKRADRCMLKAWGPREHRKRKGRPGRGKSR